MSLAGVVILYNPENNAISNINSYIGYVDELYIIDNSDVVNNKLLEALATIEKVVYIKNIENMGIAYSLNLVLKKAAEKYEWLMTMDQDSYFHQRDIENYVKILKNFDNLHNVAGIAPLPVAENSYIFEVNTDMEPVERCITSGNIIRTKTAIDVGGFEENLFIDEVDHEFCYRCNDNGYKIYLIKNIKLIHHIGNITKRSLLGIYEYYTSNHNFIRIYYITRNMLYVSQKYPNIRKKYFMEWIKRIVKILLAEDDKYRKLRSAFEGYRDYRNKKFGKKYF